MNGIVAALDDGYAGVKQQAFQKIDEFAAKDLQIFPQQSEVVAKQAISIVKNPKEEVFFHISAASVLGNLGRVDAIVTQTLSDTVNNVEEDLSFRSTAADALVELGKANTSVVKFFSELVKNSKEQSYLSIIAARALGKLGKADATVMHFLFNLVKNPKEDSFSRTLAAEALGNLGKADLSVVKFLFNLVKNPKEASISRNLAANALVASGKADASVVQFLANTVRDAKEDVYLRIKAVEALGNFGKTDASTRQFLFDRLRNTQESSGLRNNVVIAVGNLGKVDASIRQILFNLVKNAKEEIYVRISASEALSKLGKADASVMQLLANLVKNTGEDISVRSSATAALGEIKSLDLSQIFIFINATHSTDSLYFHKHRFAAYYYGRGESEIKTLMEWVGRPDILPDAEKLTQDERRKSLEVFQKAWAPSQEFAKPRAELARAIASVTSKGKWQTGDALLLEQHYKNLSDAKFSEAASVKAALDALTIWKHLKEFGYTIAAHLLFWLALIFAYPKFPQVQAIFFWNPWVRRILGVGYVGFLLAWVPFLRRKLFEPFKFSLLADARLSHFDPTAYFPESLVTLVGSRQSTPLSTTIPAIQGQIILEGSSGLGKSLFLRHLVQRSRRIVVFLPARKCENGVIEAVQAKLHGPAQDAEFLKNLIYSGAIDICIDGLNEVSADTRAKISQFVESYFKGNIILTTQPIEWIAPTTAKIYELQPLQPEQIETFLGSRGAIVAPPAEVNYAAACHHYLTQALNADQSAEELAATQRILSNPMDLTVVAQMIAIGKNPDLFRLPEQQYHLMATDYRQRWNQDFPLKQFADALYQLRLNDEKAIPPDPFNQELVSMEDEKYKMVVSRQWKNPKGEPQQEWHCRHDKIMEFFIVQTFLGAGEAAQNRLIDHMGDARFRGVYFLLATLLPIGQATDLREKLILYAADTKDHTVSDTFVQLFHSRAVLQAVGI